MPELANPTVALGVNVPSGGGLGNPLGLIGTIANAKRALVEAQTASQALAAREAAGQIISQSPSLEAAETNLQKNPLTAGFALDMVNSLATLKQTQVGTQGLAQDQTLSGLQKVFQMIGSGVNDPVSGLKNARAIVGSLSPSAQPEASKALDAIEESLAGGMQKIQGATPEETQSMRKAYAAQQMAALATATGATSPEAVRAQTGSVAPSVSMQPVGPEGQLMPVVAGGAMTQAPGASVVGAPGAPVQGISPEQSARLTTTGAMAGDLEKEMSESAATLPTEAKRLNLMQDMLQQFQAGGGAETRGEIAQSVQALKNLGFSGITDSMIKKVANGDLDALQFFNQQIKQAAIGQLKDVQKGLGRASAMEINNAIDSLSADQDPATLMRALNQAKYAMQVQYDRMGKFLDFKKRIQQKDPALQGLDLADFNNWYLANSNDKELPQATPSGIELGPRAIAQAKGAGGATPSGPSIDELLKKYSVSK